MPIDWDVTVWVVLLVGLSAVAAMIGRLTARLLLHASSGVPRRRA